MAGDGTKVGRERKYHRRVEIKEMEENIAKMEGRLIPYSLDWSVGLIRDHHQHWLSCRLFRKNLS